MNSTICDPDALKRLIEEYMKIIGINRNLSNIIADYCPEFDVCMCRDLPLLQKYIGTIEQDNKWFVDHVTNIFTEACVHGNQDVLKWLVIYYIAPRDKSGTVVGVCPNSMIADNRLRKGFTNLCINGHIEFVKWLFAMRYMHPCYMNKKYIYACPYDSSNCKDQFENLLLRDIVEPIMRKKSYDVLDANLREVLEWVEAFGFVFINIRIFIYQSNVK